MLTGWGRKAGRKSWKQSGKRLHLKILRYLKSSEQIWKGHRRAPDGLPGDVSLVVLEE